MTTSKNNPVHYKSIDLSIKVDQTSRMVSGYLAAFNNLDMANDVLMPGCFAKSITERGPESQTAGKIAYLWQHEMDEPIGRFTVLREDEKGLYFEAYVDKIPKGDEVLEQYASGTLNQHSIGFRYVWDKCRFEKRINQDGEEIEAFVCYEIKLFEGSVVTLGCNENTPFTGFKSLQLFDERKKLNRETETMLKELQPEKAYQIRQIITKHLALAQAEAEPKKSLPTDGKPLNGEAMIEQFRKSLKN